MAKKDQHLGIIDSKAPLIDITVADRDFSFAQLPGVLTSSRKAGTTGGAIWQASVRMAEWLFSETSPFSSNSELSQNIQDFRVIELGCGICPLLAFSLSTRVNHYIATDQYYILKTFEQNVYNNVHHLRSRKRSRQSLKTLKQDATDSPRSNIRTLPLDWELHDIPKQLEQHVSTGQPSSIGRSRRTADMVIACDCVFNESLVAPFVDACASICRANKNAFCVIGQQVRSPEVMELWMLFMLRQFKLFKLKPAYLTEGMSESSGFIVHLAALKSE